MNSSAAWLCAALGYVFQQPRLLEEALTYRSASSRNNERLEFLGDALLNLVIAECLFQRYPQASEGELSRLRANLVKGETLAELARGLKLGEGLRLGQGELRSGGPQRESILADALEAIFAAAYLDGGLAACRALILNLYRDCLEGLASAGESKDPKTRLQEYLQARQQPLPIYSVLEIRGEPHAQSFTVECAVADRRAVAVGSNRRKAEQDAARQVLEQLIPVTVSTHAGYAALLGRPNVGKSTLLNRLIGQKISITAPKPQTTRHVILGIQTLPEAQIVYVDTPGLHRQGRRAMNRYLNRAAASVLGYVDVVVFLIEALRWTDEDRDVLQRLADFPGPVVLAVNKVDRIADKARLLPFLRDMAGQREFVEIAPLSALKGDNVAALERAIARLLPVGDFLFPADQITTASERFLAAELIREKLTRLLREELPYALTVEIERFAEEERLTWIHAVVWVERASQKGIVIGEKGATLREVGRQARQDLERLLDRPVFLETWVKVREGWSDDERALRSLGYADPASS